MDIIESSFEDQKIMYIQPFEIAKHCTDFRDYRNRDLKNYSEISEIISEMK